MHYDQDIAIAQIRRFLRERIEPAIHRDHIPFDVAAWSAPGEPIPFGQASAQKYDRIETGSLWGRAWGTTWFHVTGSVPAHWNPADEVEAVIDLGFTDAGPGFQAEATAYGADGTVLGGVSPRHRSVRIIQPPGESISLFLEAASNPDVITDGLFKPTNQGDWASAGDVPLYRLGRIDVAVFDAEVWRLRQDVWTLLELAANVPEDMPRRATVLKALDRAIAAVDPEAVSATATRGRAALRDVLAQPAGATEHRVHAVGHAHIDSAWLWPLREAARKVTRTFSNVVALMDEYPDFVFTASSAQHWAWVKDQQPALFERIRRYVQEGRFIPTGGMWVESDTNMPGGEAMARQLTMGKRWFMDELGYEPEIVWLPDSFGYSAALPQLVRRAGSRWFLTQKLSWNETNVMPHHTFWWEGIDGSRVFTHFPPVDTYNSDLSVRELAHARRGYREKGAANTSLVPFGWGDGGGGPTREMIAAARRTADLEGSPRVSMTTPEAFFTAAESEYPDAPVWNGELYLEKHRGTYTSQAQTKRGNRRSEHLLREAETWAATATVRTDADYPYETFDQIWQQVLLNQFHDILPGSSIAWVYREAERTYRDLARRLEDIVGSALGALAGSGNQTMWANAGPMAIDGVPALGAGFMRAPEGEVTVDETTEGIVVANDHVALTFDHHGLLVSLLDRGIGRELVRPGVPANVFQLFRDAPARWDAWDIDAAYELDGVDLIDLDETAIERTDQKASVRFVRSTDRSTIVQTIRLGTGPSVDITIEVDWHEHQRLLKLAFPFDLHAQRSASEIQFGHVERPTHANTSWDAARFEICAHRWIHIGEPDYGVSLANDSTYGYDIRRQTTDSGDSTTTVRPSLLRAPMFPDPEADQGRHEFGFSLRVGATIRDAVSEGYRLNLPLRRFSGGRAIAPLFSTDDDAVLIETVKLADDRSGDVVVRLYEPTGSRAVCALTPQFEYSAVMTTDLLERPEPDPATLIDVDDEVVRLALRPFQIVTLRFVR